MDGLTSAAIDGCTSPKTESAGRAVSIVSLSNKASAAGLSRGKSCTTKTAIHPTSDTAEHAAQEKGIEMIDITGLREDKRPQSSTIVHALLDRLEAAEKDIALKERVIDSLGSELNAVAKERDNLRAKIEAMEKQEPIGWFARVDGDGPLMECKHEDVPRVPLYARVGAQGEEK